MKKWIFTILGLFVLALATAHLFAQVLGTWTYIPEGTCPTSGTASASLLCSNSADHAMSFSFNAGGIENIPQSFYSTSIYSNASTTFSTVAPIQFPVSINRSYSAQCDLIWFGSASTAGPKYQWTGPLSAVTSMSTGLISGTAVAAFTSAAATSFGTTLANTGAVTAGQLLVDHIWMNVVTGATGNGTVALQAAANGSGTYTIPLNGAVCHVQ